LSALYEWNIDSLLEYEILNVLHEMMIVANVYKCVNRSDHQVASSLITGFTGQLKGWWDNILTEEQRSYLKIAYKTDVAGNIITNEHNQPIEDAVNTLIFAITKHFVGDPSVYRENIYDSLEHLKYPTLTDFRWYKDVFLSRVLIRTDNRAPYWKEKFIGGLPKYFAHKVREKLNNDGHNDYTSLTYGEIINVIKHVGLNLCNDLRLTNQLKNDMKYAKQELGSFCEQYGFPHLIASSTKHKHKKYSNKKMKSYKPYKKYYE
jgi:hypothetical protein